MTVVCVTGGKTRDWIGVIFIPATPAAGPTPPPTRPSVRQSATARGYRGQLRPPVASPARWREWRRRPTTANATPSVPPSAASRIDSIRNWRSKRRDEAPNATRTDVSDARLEAAHQRQQRDVGTGNEQHEPDGGEEDPQQPCGSPMIRSPGIRDWRSTRGWSTDSQPRDSPATRFRSPSACTIETPGFNRATALT